MATLYTRWTIQLIFLAVILLPSRVVLSQSETIPDTLDPRGYMPLKVGNTWEYWYGISRPVTIYRPVDESKILLERYVVLGEVSRNDSLFFNLLYDVRNSDGTPYLRDTVLVRYDTLTASIQGTELPQIFEWLRCLDAPFWSTNDSNGFCWDFISADAEPYPELTNNTEPIPIKHFESYVWGFRTSHGIGILSGGGGCEPCDAFSDTDYWLLKYAWVNGKSYGAEIVSVGSYRLPKPSFTVYPNPASTEVFVNSSQSGVIEFFDVLGRRGVKIEMRLPGIEKINLQNYQPGMYIIRMDREVRTLIVQ